MNLSRLSVLCAALLLTGCFVPKASVTPTFLQLSVDGSFGATETGSSVNSDFEDLGLDDDESILYPRADLSWLGMHLSLSSLSGSFSGSGQLEGTITIDDTTITAGTDVDSDFDLSAHSAVFTWDIIPIGMAELGLGLGVTLMDLDLVFEEVSGPEKVETDETFPIPLLAVRVGFDGAPIEVNASAGFVSVDIDDVDATVLDLDVNGALHLFGGDERLAADLVLGYRMFDVDVEYDDGDSDIDADFEITGPYLGLRLSF